MQIDKFLQKWMQPVGFVEGKPVEGLFTGYYMALLHGSRTKTDKYNVPLYGIPDNLIKVDLGDFDPELANKRIVGRKVGNKMVPYYTRKEIVNGAIDSQAKVIAWVDSKVERLFLEIQGSGVVQFDDGSKLYVGYVAQNGSPYTAIAGILIKKGEMTRDSASMQRIRKYFTQHPDKINEIIYTYEDILVQI